ncbi:unnamed protein product [Paramecium sonneborni]|uniref:non-specific serine/threonine protein kinase n=1 Tax=Paramecium sonneborni TaxID=65129 RepID=A0A8S1LJE9_9CILI|nr:unnamed protein product [Paramecium sonneborni]
MSDSSSYFDIQGKGIWEQYQNKLNEEDIVYKGVLQFHNKTTQFCLTEYELFRFKKNGELKKIELLTTSISLFNDNTILLQKNHKQVFLKSSPQNIKLWFEQIKNKCIQNNFRLDYDIGELIGQGQFANVYKITNKKNNQKYALKVFQKVALKNLNVDNVSVAKEIKIMRQLKHPGIIKIYEVYEDKEFICIVMELMQYSMKQQKKKHAEHQCAQIMLQLFMMLQYIHDHKIIHRDIKPDNILYKNQDTICICDFGLADYYNPMSVYQYQRCGTPGYVAPEVLRDQKYDYKVDVYSAGIILYTLLVGKQPFSAHSQNKVVQLNYHGKIDFAQVKASDLCLSFLKSVLSINPQTRPSAYEVLHHEWFFKTLGESNYFYMLNNNGKQVQNIQPVSKEIQNFQAIQSMMDEEQDESSNSKIQIEIPQPTTQYRNNNNCYYQSSMPQQQQHQQSLQIAIDNIQEAIKQIKIKQQVRDLNYLTQMLHMQHKEMSGID